MFELYTGGRSRVIVMVIYVEDGSVVQSANPLTVNVLPTNVHVTVLEVDSLVNPVTVQDVLDDTSQFESRFRTI